MSVEHYNSVIYFDVDRGLKRYAGITTYYIPKTRSFAIWY